MNDIENLIKKIHVDPHQTVIAIAGAGSLAVAWLLSMPGASKTILESVVPYGRLSMVNLLGFEPDQYVCPETAQAMAKACYQRGMELRENDLPVLGVACTATLVTDRIKRGDHRCSLAVWSDDKVLNCDLVLEKGKRDRSGEEELVSRMLLQILSKSMNLESSLDIEFSGNEVPQCQSLDHANAVSRLLAGDVDSILVEVDGTMNVDKPSLEEAEINRRLAQFIGKFKVVLTRAETFQKKSRLFKNTEFVIGWDTVVRLIDPHYYGDDYRAMCAALAELCVNGNKFLVAGRVDGSSFKTLEDVPIPGGFSFLFSSIPESVFRLDVSSTQLRDHD